MLLSSLSLLIRESRQLSLSHMEQPKEWGVISRANAIVIFFFPPPLIELLEFSYNHSDETCTNRWVTGELWNKQHLLCLQLLSSLLANVIQIISGVDVAEFCFQAVRKQTPAVISKELFFSWQCFFSIRCRAFPPFQLSGVEQEVPPLFSGHPFSVSSHDMQ